VNEDAEPFIPPRTLLILSGIGFLVAVVVRFTQPVFGIVGFGGLAVAVLGLVAFVLLSPRSITAGLRSRSVRYGTLTLAITVLFLVALAFVYLLARGANVRVDLTERNDFSLTEQSRQAITGLAADPTLPQVRLIAFYGAAQAGIRDSNSALFDDYQTTSGGKITYEFIDPDRNPQVLALYGAQPGQIAVVAENADGTLDTENAELISGIDQQALTNGILQVAASGNFIAYILNVRDGVGEQMSLVRSALTDSYDWTIVDTTLIELTAPEGEFRLNDPERDGEVVVIPGGSAPLSDDELAILTDYIDAGGNVVIFAGPNINPDGESLATSENLNAYLSASFGLRFSPEIVADETQAYQSALIPVATDFNTGAFITTTNVERGQALIFETPNPIVIEPDNPVGVTVTTLASSSDQAYSIADLTRLTGEDVNAAAPRDDDPRGPFVLAASAENTTTGARVVLLSSTAVGTDTAAFIQSAANLSVGFNSLIWATNFDSFVNQITIIQEQRPQDAPLFADEQTIGTINFITLIVLPFGMLAVGAYVWWSNRERARE
jgi:hypothetical protein